MSSRADPSREATETALAGIPAADRERNRWLVERLVEAGVSAEEVAAGYHEGGLLSLLVDRWLGEEGGERLIDVAERHGLDPQTLAANRRALGLPVETEEPAYGAGLDQQASRLADYLAAGFSEDGILLFNRVVGRSMAAIAATAAEVLVERLLADEDVPAERAAIAAQAVVGLVPVVEEGMRYVFREHVRQLVRREAAAQLESGRLGAAEPIAVAFVDMVGFTRRGEVVSASELGELAERLEAIARETGGEDVIVVKVIGDAAMLVSREPAKLIEAVLGLLERGLDPDVDLPPMRAGAAYGEAARRGGDYFGHAVNLASRLTAVAEPHCLAADEALHKATEGDGPWRPAGPRELRGVQRPVEVYLTSPARAG